jgi:hypothetical protein
VEVELSDFSNFGDILLDLKLIPDDLRLPIPRFIIEERQKDVNARRALLVSLRGSSRKPDPWNLTHVHCHLP